MCTYIFLLIRDVIIYLFYYASSNIELIVAVPTAVVHAARAVRNFLSIALQGLGQGDTLFRCLIVRVFALLLRACTTPMLRRQAVQSVQLTTVVSFYPGSCIKVVPLIAVSPHLGSSSVARLITVAYILLSGFKQSVSSTR